MDSTTSTPMESSVVTSDSTTISSQSQLPTPSRILEISLISAQDLAPVCKSMRTFAVAWIDTTRKLTTRIDQRSDKNPTWNEKFSFRVEDELLLSEDMALNVEIYTISWFKDVLVGTVRILISDLINLLGRTTHNHRKNTRFVALQVRRPSGSPQGILNMGVALVDSTMRSMPLHNHVFPPIDNNRNATVKRMDSFNKQEDEKKEEKTKIHLWRSLSAGSELNNDDFPLKPGSVYNSSTANGNGSIVNGSEVCSDIGPSASIVAAELAKKSQPPRPVNQRKLNRNTQHDETGSSILEELTVEEARAKGYRSTTKWRNELSIKNKDDEDESDQSELLNDSRHLRRHSDGGLFSCFAYGIGFTIVCGASKNPRDRKFIHNSKSRKKFSNSETSSA